MNKKDLVKTLQEKLAKENIMLNLNKIEIILHTLEDTIIEVTDAGNEVKLTNFGKFERKRRKARIGKNPRNPKETVEIPECSNLTFKPSSRLKIKY